MFSKLKLSLIHYSYVIFYLILSVSIIRLLEYAYILSKHTEEVSFALFFGRSLTFDAFFVLGASLVFLLPYLLLSYLSQKAGKIFIGIVGTLVIFAFLGLTQHFLTTNTVMTAMLFEFSLSDMTHTVTNELSLERIIFWAVYIVILPLTVYTLFFRFKKIKFSTTKSQFMLNAYILLALVAGLNIKGYSKPLNQFDCKYHYLLGNCKATFLLESWIETKQNEAMLNLNNEDKVIEQLETWSEFRGELNSDLQHPYTTNEAYENVLGEYFKKSETKPNIVYIIAESLSSSFSGDQTALGDLAPFTKSLMQDGLYWNNFYSNAQLSFGVMPNLLASLPFGLTERGFVNTQLVYESGNRFPQHSSIVDILNQNDYTTAYYYGGLGNFDHVGDFIRGCHIDEYTEEDSFTSIAHGPQNPRPHDKLMWGYNDKVLYGEGLQRMRAYASDKPHFSIFQTLSLHSPYNMCSKEYYDEKFIDSKLEVLNMKRKDLIKIDPAALSSILFADDALKMFFEEYKKRDDYENTIFVITGDHAINKLDLTNHPLERYRVPLIIYSPLLTKTEVFKGSCSHADVTPSMLALLEGNFGLEIPKRSSWIGEGLDVSKRHRNNRIIQLNLHSFQFPVFIYKDYFVYSHEVYKMNSYLGFELVADKAKSEEILSIYQNFKFINNYAIARDKIVPVAN